MGNWNEENQGSMVNPASIKKLEQEKKLKDMGVANQTSSPEQTGAAPNQETQKASATKDSTPVNSSFEDPNKEPDEPENDENRIIETSYGPKPFWKVKKRFASVFEDVANKAHLSGFIQFRITPAGDTMPIVLRSLDHAGYNFGNQIAILTGHPCSWFALSLLKIGERMFEPIDFEKIPERKAVAHQDDWAKMIDEWMENHKDRFNSLKKLPPNITNKILGEFSDFNEAYAQALQEDIDDPFEMI